METSVAGSKGGSGEGDSTSSWKGVENMGENLDADLMLLRSVLGNESVQAKEQQQPAKDGTVPSDVEPLAVPNTFATAMESEGDVRVGTLNDTSQRTGDVLEGLQRSSKLQSGAKVFDPAVSLQLNLQYQARALWACQAYSTN